MQPPCRPGALFALAISSLLIVSAVFLVTFPALAQEAPINARTVKVGVYVSPPFVEKEGDGYSGMAIDLWNKTATDLKLTSDFHEFRNYTDLTRAVTSGAVDAAVTNLSITAERAAAMDFTHPWFDAGLRVMVERDDGTSFGEVIEKLNDAGHLQTYAWIATTILAATLLMTLFDRTFDSEFPKKWREGLAESFYHVMSIATSGKSGRKNLFGWAGRIWQGLWMVCGVAVIAYITSSITSVMTAAAITNQINSVADLQGKTVGVQSGSIAEEFMASSFGNTMPFDHLSDAVAALANGEIVAIVGDAPVLEYYAYSRPEVAVKVIGNTFRPDKYGFAFNVGSNLRKPVSLAIIASHEDGSTEKLRSNYFGMVP